jgi:hypothetical protein
LSTAVVIRDVIAPARQGKAVITDAFRPKALFVRMQTERHLIGKLGARGLLGPVVQRNFAVYRITWQALSGH